VRLLLGLRGVVSSVRSLRSLLDQLWFRPMYAVRSQTRWLRSERSERLETTHPQWLLALRVWRSLVSSVRSLRSLLDHL